MQALHSRPFVSGGALHSSRRGVSRPNRSTVCRVDAVARRSLTLQEQLKSVRAAFEERQQAIADRIGWVVWRQTTSKEWMFLQSGYQLLSHPLDTDKQSLQPW